MTGNESSATQVSVPTTNRPEPESTIQLDIKIFSGKDEEYQNWKAATIALLGITGHGDILTSHSFATENTIKNTFVYNILTIATVDGLAYHNVNQHKTTRDGHMAWKSLLEWYEGRTGIDAEYRLRDRYDSLELVPGVQPSVFINDFLNAHYDLRNNHTVVAKIEFFRKIIDPKYNNFRCAISMAPDTLSLEEMAGQLQQFERRRLEERRKERQRQHQLNPPGNVHNSQNRKRRKRR